MMTAAMILEMSAGMSKHDFEYAGKAMLDVTPAMVGDGEAKDSNHHCIWFWREQQVLLK